MKKTIFILLTLLSFVAVGQSTFHGKNYTGVTHFNSSHSGSDTSKQQVADSIKITTITSSLLKTNGSGKVTPAVAGTDYQAPLTNPVTGTMTSGQVAYASGTSTVTSEAAFTYSESTNTLTVGKPYITDKMVIPSTAIEGIVIHNQSDTTTNTETLKIRKSGNVFQIISSATGSGTQRELLLQGGGRGVRIGAFTGPQGFYNFSLATGSTTTNVSGIGVNGIVSNSSATNNGYSFTPTYNQSGSAGYRCSWLSPFLQAVGSGPKYLADWGSNSAADGSGTHTSSFVMDQNGTSFIGSGSATDLTTDKFSIYSSSLNQLKCANTSTQYWTASTNSSGVTTFNAVGSSASFVISDATTINGNFTLGTAGNGLLIKEGTNATMGTATLVGGTVVVNTTKATASSRIFLTVKTAGGTQGFLSYTVSAGTSFTITSTSGTETSTVSWFIVEPAP
jgi:hypothetical protein